jgi:hypothetical protein
MSVRITRRSADGGNDAARARATMCMCMCVYVFVWRLNADHDDPIRDFVFFCRSKPFFLPVRQIVLKKSLVSCERKVGSNPFFFFLDQKKRKRTDGRKKKMKACFFLIVRIFFLSDGRGRERENSNTHQ